MPGCKALTDTEIANVLRYLHNPRDRCLFILGIRTGFRISELLSIRVSQVIQYGNVVSHLTVNRSDMKGSKASRTVKLHNDAINAVRTLVNSGLAPGDALFKSRLGGSISRRQAWHILKRAFNAAQITGRTGTHCMRKSLASRVYEASGKDIRVTQHALGHKSLNSTASYLATDDSQVDDIISNLE